MSPEIAAFENECAVAGVAPAAAVEAGGLNPSTWFRWRNGASSPNLRSFAAARAGLQILVQRSHSSHPSSSDAQLVAPGADHGAEKSLAVFSPAEDAA
jgi:hypothetical protein